MQEIIEKLLVLQARDRNIFRVSQELDQINPERENLRLTAAVTQKQLDAARLRAKQIEAESRQRDLEIEAKKAQIAKYLNQQLLTRKNEEYRALAREIEMAREAIFKIEDAVIALMEQTEAAQQEMTRAAAAAAAAQKQVEEQIGGLDARAANLKKELAELTETRAALAGAVEESTCRRYERLLKSKGENVVVGVERSACGGCHMKLPAQTVNDCRGQIEVVTCPNCGRILYYTPDMEMYAAD